MKSLLDVIGGERYRPDPSLSCLADLTGTSLLPSTHRELREPLCFL